MNTVVADGLRDNKAPPLNMTALARDSEDYCRYMGPSGGDRASRMPADGIRSNRPPPRRTGVVLNTRVEREPLPQIKPPMAALVGRRCAWATINSQYPPEPEPALGHRPQAAVVERSS